MHGEGVGRPPAPGTWAHRVHRRRWRVRRGSVADCAMTAGLVVAAWLLASWR